MKITWRRPQGRALRTFTTALVLTVLAALLLAGTALAVAKPGRPTAKAPRSTVTATKPTFTWSKAARATNYEVRVYQGTRVVLKKTGLTRLSWKSSKALPTNANLTWKVRASNAGGNGAWSWSLKFQVVTVAALVVGQDYGGGVVAYILQPGDPGYVANVQHGLIAATADQSTGITWALPDYGSASVPGGTLTAIGTGSTNTDKIIAQNGLSSAYAARLARDYTDGVYHDWYLPSKDELHKLYLNQTAIGGFDTTKYAWFWSSSEYSQFYAWSESMSFAAGGFQYNNYKDTPNLVRAVRAF